ncbi:hypothetical protein BDM02DRAFT_3193521 [Thelephora ganbajun]|uniref:Uncharacterized protein n=1 Tax=Thelephora ganbajun TaxID=370292 RepID=A0ACB6YZK2_THEGA|nr:hypothetical protein BDM02DRAFT_3193521 [Thelephora ganbajun]
MVSDSTIIPSPPPVNGPPSPLTRMSNGYPIQSKRPPLSVSSSLRDRDSEDRDQARYKGGLYDSPVIPVMKIPQVDEVHIVPLLDAEEGDKELSISHHAYNKSNLWSWTKRNTAVLADVVPETPSPPVSPFVGGKIYPDVMVDIGPSNSASMTIIAEGLEPEQTSASSYLLDVITPLSGSIN